MNNKVILLIGHRGVGKTSLLRRINTYCNKYNVDADTIDLDQCIEQNENQSITDIFKSSGEKKFRSLEKKYLVKLIQNSNKRTYISVGAGFMGPYPEDAEIIFIKRDTDKNGRIFLNRPRLNKEVSAFEEYKELYNKREQHYSGTADLTLFLQEGQKENNLYEEIFFGFVKNKNIGGVYTLLPQETPFVNNYLNWGIDKIEVRTDYFNEIELNSLIEVIPEDQLLLSVRDNKKIPIVKHMDWPLEMGTPDKDYLIISNHTKGNGLEAAITQLEECSSLGSYLKLAVPIETLAELKRGHEWHLSNPATNCFLPISIDGRFSWYRLIQKNKIFPNFFKTTEQGSAADQPYFYDWVNNDFENINAFAAIIGLPVNHSWTPNEHQSFFTSLHMPVVKINISEGELTKENLSFLSALGLKAAAVTSPLKHKISDIINSDNQIAINTIVNTGTRWLTTNTDDHGFNVLAGHLKNNDNIVLWGGGGVINSVKKILPKISSYSARSGGPRDGEQKIENPDMLVWAIGRSRHENWPNRAWAPKIIVDLNYSEDSPGKEYALMVGAKYISGADMFVAQASQQQNFWRKHLK